MDDDTKIDFPMKLELVLLSYCMAPETEKLLSAASTGSVAEVGSSKKLQIIVSSNLREDVPHSGFGFVVWFRV